MKKLPKTLSDKLNRVLYQPSMVWHHSTDDDFEDVIKEQKHRLIVYQTDITYRTGYLTSYNSFSHKIESDNEVLIKFAFID